MDDQVDQKAPHGAGLSGGRHCRRLVGEDGPEFDFLSKVNRIFSAATLPGDVSRLPPLEELFTKEMLLAAEDALEILDVGYYGDFVPEMPDLRHVLSAAILADPERLYAWLWQYLLSRAPVQSEGKFFSFQRVRHRLQDGSDWPASFVWLPLSARPAAVRPTVFRAIVGAMCNVIAELGKSACIMLEILKNLFVQGNACVGGQVSYHFGTLGHSRGADGYATGNIV